MAGKTHYDLLGVEPTADFETIKKAFRREIARYHPDKVAHLGQEFQEMASERAAELTAAYKALTDPETRADYDAGLGSSPVATPSRPSTGAASAPAPPADDAKEEPPLAPPPGKRFEQERAGRDDIMRRAVLMRVRDVLQQMVGDCDIKAIKGFDFACMSKAKPSLFRRTVPPSVLVVLAPIVDAQVATEAWMNAVKARIVQKPLVLLLIGNQLAPAGELARAIDDARKKTPALQDAMFPVPVDIRDWSAKMPANAPDAVRALIERLRNYVG